MTIKINFSILSLLMFFPLYSQNNITETKEHALWYHQSMELDSVPGISTYRAYDELLKDRKGEKVIVAVIDAGIDVNHDDLQGIIWKNPNEKEGNEIDDDGNGYIDDIHGWNFLGNRNGKNIIYDTKELTRSYRKLKTKFADIDTNFIDSSNIKLYSKYKKIKHEFETERTQLIGWLNEWIEFKQQFLNNIDILTPYTLDNELSLEFLKDLTVNDDSTVNKALEELILCYEWEYTLDLIDKKIELHQNYVDYKLNPDYYSRTIIGDDPENLDERNYGNPIINVDGEYHGTSVAGMIGAIRSNSIGIDGVTNNVEIMSLRAVPSGDERDKDIANAIYYAIDNGARIINMSFGKDISPNEFHVEKALKYAEKNDVLIISCAMNDATNTDEKVKYPDKIYFDGGEYQAWINVGANSKNMDSTLVSDFSNYGKNSVDVFAPGEDIKVLRPQNNTDTGEGTSYSSPLVAGVAALIWSHYPDFSALEIKNIILKSVDYYGEMKVLLPEGEGKKVSFKDLSVTGGIVNAYKALILANEINIGESE